MAILGWPQGILKFKIKGKLGRPDIPDTLGIWGIYRVWRRWGKEQCFKEKFYVPYNPRTEPQQANRMKFASAVAAWQALTPEQKELYNKKAANLNMSGYNLFISEFMYG